MVYWTLILSLLAVASGILGFTEFHTILTLFWRGIFYLTLTVFVVGVATLAFESESSEGHSRRHK